MSLATGTGLRGGSLSLGQRETRAAIAKACQGLTVTDADGEVYTLTAYEDQPVAPSPLDVWPVWEHTEWLNACARAVTWYVYAVLPQTYPIPSALADDFAEVVGGAVYPLGRIQRAEPVSLALDTNQPPVPAIRVTIET